MIRHLQFERGLGRREHTRRDRARNPFEPRNYECCAEIETRRGEARQDRMLLLDKLVTGPGCVRCQGRLLRLSEITIRHTGCVLLLPSFFITEFISPSFLISLFTPPFPPHIYFYLPLY
jgi:hypothetical protein